MYPELKNRVALVTGGSRGFGRAIALKLAEDGAKLIINYRRSKSEAEEVAEKIKEMGSEAVAIRADVGKEEAVEKMFNEIEERFGKLDILIANAAFGVPGKVFEATPKHWDITMSASARSLLDMAKRAVPLMHNGYGRIVSISSEGGQKVIPGYGVVGPAKAALESLTRSLAYELAPKNILVNGILAGLADTKSARSIPGAEEILSHAQYHTPMRQIVQPDDIASAVAFLVSDQAKKICGQFIIVDGGRSIVA